MAVTTTNLGVITAYGDAVAAGYTGTKAEWQALMASYATVAEEANQAKDDAVSAKNTAVAKATEATTAAATANTAKDTATSKATEATTAANTATTKASEAAASAQNIAQSASQIAQNTSDINELKEDLTKKLEYISKIASSDTEITQISFPNTDKVIDGNGDIASASGYAVTDYIDLTDVTGVYRTGQTIKFTLWRYAFYDAEYNLLSVAGGDTDYEIVDYEGQQVTWLTLNPNAKYVRISWDTTRAYTYYYVSPIAIYEVPNLIINGENIYNDVLIGKKVNDISHDISVNILNPSNFKANGYYLDFSDGVTHISNANYKMTADWLEINQDYIYVIQTFSTTATNNFVVYCYDTSGTYLGYKVGPFNELGSNFKVVLYTGTRYIRLFSNAGALITGEMLCITLDKVPDFEAYNLERKIKYNALPFDLSPHYLPLYGKIIANFGDSVFGNKRPPNDISTALANITGATVYNLGFGGCRMSYHANGWDAFSMYRLAEAIATKDYTYQDSVDIDNISGMPQYFKETRALLESVDFDTVDIITIAYGTNDFTAGIPLDNENNPLDVNTFGGALRYSLETILTAYPHLHIFVCTPTYRFWIDTENNNAFLYDSDTHEINGKLLTDFVEAVQTVSKAYHVKSIDNYYDLGIDKFNRSHWFPANDGTHHNKDGGMLIAQHMATELF